MEKLKTDLLNACFKRRIDTTFEDVRNYAYLYKKYDVLSMRDIDEVVYRLKKFHKEVAKQFK
jgi:hypothetical protein